MKSDIQLRTIKTTAVVFMILLISSSFSGLTLKAQQKENEWIDEFIATYNSNEPTRIRGMLVEKFHKAYHNTTRYWQGVFREFGAVDLVSFGKDSINGRAMIWARSKQTKNFVGFAYKLSESTPPIINRMGVIRGMIPSGMKRKSPDLKQVEQDIKEYLAVLGDIDAFSGTVLVAKGDEVILNESIGYSNREEETLNESNTKFLIASTTKMFTAVAVAQLVEQGQLNYDDAVSKYLSDYPKHIGDKVKIHHLLTHSSGIELDEMSSYNKGMIKIQNLEEFYKLYLKHLSKLKNYNDFELPEEFNYTNEGFDLAGYIVEKVSGESFYDYVAKNIFSKASMNNTGDFQMGKDISNLAKGYSTSNSGARKLNTKSLPQRSRPAGSFYSTPLDLFRFVTALQKGELIKKESFEEMNSPKITSFENSISNSKYGYGMTLGSLGGVKSWGHAGVAPGASSRCNVYPESGFTVIVLSNYGKAGAVVANYIRDLIHFDLD